MYKVIKYFTDLKDDGHPYNVGDTYPKKGLTVTEARIKELASSKNRQGVPLIEEVSGKAPAKETEAVNDGAVAEEADEKPKPRAKRSGTAKKE